MSFEVCGPGEVDAYFAQLVDLHQQRWTASGKPGCFASERFTRFHHSLAHTLVPAGQAILARLRHGAGPLAVLYGFTTGTKFDFYQCGVLPERHGKVKSPGTVVHLLLMEWLAGRGFTTYDFLRGSADYKKRLATASRQLVTVQVTRPTLRTAAGRTAELLGRAVRRSARMITRQTAPGRGLQSEATR